MSGVAFALSSAAPQVSPAPTALLRGCHNSINKDVSASPTGSISSSLTNATFLLSVSLLVAVTRRRNLNRGDVRKDPVHCVACRAEGENSAGEEDEAEKIFREAYEAEAERSKLLASQLEVALAAQLGMDPGSGVKIAVQAPEAKSPLDAGSESTTWRQAYEAVKVRNASLETQLQKAKGLNKPPTPPPSSEAKEAEVADAAAWSQRDTSSASDNTSSSSGPKDIGKDLTDINQELDRIREVATLAKEEDTLLRLVAQAALPNQDKEKSSAGKLPSLDVAKQALTPEDFQVDNVTVLEGCYIFAGKVAGGRTPEAALQSMQNRMKSLSTIGAAETELYIQPAKEDGKAIIVMLHRSDLPDSEVPGWQLALFGFLIIFTFFVGTTNTFSVVPVTQQMMENPDAQQVSKMLQRLLPTSVGIMATVAAQETTRRIVASFYGVELSPPFLIPGWPIVSAGCLGAVTRRLSPTPNKEAEFAMSAAASTAGLVVSLLIIAIGLSSGPGEDGINLNFRLLPVCLKFLLRPLLGSVPIMNQADPFADPSLIAFPASPTLVGGVVGLVVTCLSLLPIGRLDGGILARSAIGDAANVLGTLSFTMLIVGSFAPDDFGGSLYLTFGIAALIWQSGAELPPKEGITDIGGAQKAVALLLVATGVLLSIPGYGLPSPM
eukprot:TRINITY_DN8405_c0_g1_i5.p1 TRINITY_DN8405_c0_g1~~TRINITY_DN8405_c0_g1_i5.p1  ORF type:complete len:665 (-),score=136.76 TRINITY_DN8405_c0_g1_i5:232-2226(-)